jgi:RsiW-degrading membrane proteinase PrsW (M82 family)
MSPIEYGVNYFVSFFQNPSAWGIGLAIAFGAVWLACYRPPLFKKPWLWAVLVSSTFLTLAAVSFIQIPLLNLLNWIDDQLYTHYSPSYFVLHRLFYLAGMPLIVGLVQEGAKLVPVVVWWQRSGRNLDPKLGLTIGAVAGAGFGILQMWGVLGYQGYAYNFFNPASLNGFLCTSFTVAAQIAFPALAGYGLARGWGWQFYLIASALHGLLHLAWRLFPPVWSFPETRLSIGACVYTAVLAALVTAWALWLRWRKTATTVDPTISYP